MTAAERHEIQEALDELIVANAIILPTDEPLIGEHVRAAMELLRTALKRKDTP